MSIRKLIILILSATVLVIIGWALFGYKTVDNKSIGLIRYHRIFGKALIITVDVNRDGRKDGKYYHSWNSPADSGHSRPYRYVEDRNLDGKWDVWVEETQERINGESVLLFDVDLTADGESDWSFTSTDSLAAYREIDPKLGVEGLSN